MHSDIEQQNVVYGEVFRLARECTKTAVLVGVSKVELRHLLLSRYEALNVLGIEQHNILNYVQDVLAIIKTKM